MANEKDAISTAMPKHSEDAVGSEKCPTCHGEGEVYAEAPWCRWFDCGDCGGTGLHRCPPGCAKCAAAYLDAKDRCGV